GKAFMREAVQVVERERDRLSRLLGGLGLRPQRTDANFMIVDVGEPSGKLRAFLRSKGVVTREMGDFKGLENFIRVTVGRPEHTDRLASLIREYRSLGRGG